MSLKLTKTFQQEAPILLAIQQEAFQEDLLKYEDHATSPANETIERLQLKIEQFEYFTIRYDNKIIGGIDIRIFENHHYRLNRIYIATAFQNKGLGSQIMKLIEKQFSNARSWSLDTPQLNTRNQYFYEKFGYIKVGEHRLSDKLTLFDFEKIMTHES